MIKGQISGLIDGAVRGVGFPTVDFSVEHPADLANGDYATNVALVVAKQAGKNPKYLAEKIKAEIEKNIPPEIKKIEIAGPGFINFYLADDFLTQQVREILKQNDNFGKNKNSAGKKVIVEYSSPNIAKPFTVGHLRSTIIGDAVANLLVANGFEVIRDNHLGDWGTQFGKLIVAIKKWGNLEEIKKTNNPIKNLVDLYVHFHSEAEKDESLEDEGRAEFAKLEAGDTEAKKIWQECVALSQTEFRKIYERLNVKFDTQKGESFFVGKIKPVYEALQDKNLLVESDGAKVVMLGEKMPPLIIEKSDGSTIYATRDLAADLWRKNEYQPDLIINEVGSEQSLYFRQLFAVEKMLGWFEEGERVHVAHGLYRFKEGKMSTRKGEVVWLEDVLEEAVKRASEFNADQAVAEVVAIGAIKYNDLKREAKLDVIFDWDEILNLKGNSGPYLQYTFARTQSVLEKAGRPELSGSNFEKLAQGDGRAEINLARFVRILEITDESDGGSGTVEKLLYRFPEVVERAAREYAPHHLCTYLYELAGAFNAYYAENKIMSDEPGSAYRVALTAAVGQVLKNGLTMLGIEALESM